MVNVRKTEYTPFSRKQTAWKTTKKKVGSLIGNSEDIEGRKLSNAALKKLKNA